MTPDPKWLEILKASGGQTFALGCAFGGLLLFHYMGWVPPLEPWMIQAATVLFLLGSLLWLASILGVLNSFLRPRRWLLHWISTWRHKRRVRNYIPFMTEEERKIIAYLLHHNQKMFTADSDGGYATTLISRRIVVRALQRGQVFSMDDTPFTVEDDVWNVLVAHKYRFPYKAGEHDPHPWRVDWRLR